MTQMHPHSGARPAGQRIHVTLGTGDVQLEVYLSLDHARLLAAQIQAAANAVTAAPVIHQREAGQ